MVFAVVERAGTIVMNDKEELDSWSVIINGEVRIDRIDPETGAKTKKFLKCGDAFGIEPTMEKLYHQVSVLLNSFRRHRCSGQNKLERF